MHLLSASVLCFCWLQLPLDRSRRRSPFPVTPTHPRQNCLRCVAAALPLQLLLLMLTRAACAAPLSACLSVCQSPLTCRSAPLPV
jgi:hypothetical protein